MSKLKNKEEERLEEHAKNTTHGKILWEILQIQREILEELKKN